MKMIKVQRLGELATKALFQHVPLKTKATKVFFEVAGSVDKEGAGLDTIASQRLNESNALPRVEKLRSPKHGKVEPHPRPGTKASLARFGTPA